VPAGVTAAALERAQRRSLGANVGATRANNIPRQADRYGQPGRDHPSARTDPDDAERLTGIYGSEGWGFESLRARTPLAPPGEASLTKINKQGACH